MAVRGVRIVVLAWVCATGVSAWGQSELPSAATPPAYPSLSLIGFMDISFFASDDAVAPRSGFSEGQFILHFTSSLSTRLTTFAEVSLTARRDAAVNASVAGFNAEVERIVLKYNQSDWLKASVGRFHTPINYWNVAFHHGQWLQTSIGRPEMTQFGGAFIPVHFVGVLLEGTAAGRGLGVDYTLGLGNGRSTVISRAGDAADVNESRATLGGLAFRPEGLYGLQVGAAAYNDRITGRGLDHGEWITSAYAAFTRETPEVLAEVAHIRHRDLLTDQTFGNTAYYVQVAYRLPVFQKRLKPYLRWEKMRIDEKDPVFASLGDSTSAILGVRLDLFDLAALKLEGRRQEKASAPYVNAIHAQVSFTF